VRCFAVGNEGGWELVVLCGVCDRGVGGVDINI
jgi:hypothetical protein